MSSNTCPFLHRHPPGTTLYPLHSSATPISRGDGALDGALTPYTTLYASQSFVASTTTIPLLATSSYLLPLSRPSLPAPIPILFNPVHLPLPSSPVLPPSFRLLLIIIIII